jgi:hypothetical protein
LERSSEGAAESRRAAASLDKLGGEDVDRQAARDATSSQKAPPENFGVTLGRL